MLAVSFRACRFGIVIQRFRTRCRGNFRFSADTLFGLEFQSCCTLMRKTAYGSLADYRSESNHQSGPRSHETKGVRDGKLIFRRRVLLRQGFGGTSQLNFGLQPGASKLFDPHHSQGIGRERVSEVRGPDAHRRFLGENLARRGEGIFSTRTGAGEHGDAGLRGGLVHSI